MTPEVPITRRGSRLQDESENDEKRKTTLRRQGSDVASVDVNESSATLTTEKYRSWSLEDVEGDVMTLLDDIVISSVGLSMENVISSRLFTYVATWGKSVLQEMLVSAIAPTGDVSIDSSELSTMNSPRVLLGRTNAQFESPEPPKSCPIDATYQRRQIPMRAAKRHHYDNESLNNAVKAAIQSHTHPASITSSRHTVKSKMRRKQHGASSAQMELTGHQPGVPYSVDIHDSPHEHKHHIAFPREAVAEHHLVEPTYPLCQTEPTHESAPPPSDPNAIGADTGAALKLNIDTENLRQGNSIASSRTHRSPPPLSHSPSSISSARRRPQPPGSALSVHPAKVFCFGERDEEVKVVYAVSKSPPRRNTKSVLPDISSGRITPRPSLSRAAFGAFGSTNNDSDGNDKESLFDEDPLRQHFQTMPLSPGRMDTCTLPAPSSDPLSPRTQISTNQNKIQPRNGTFITETAWDLGPSTSRISSEGQIAPHGTAPRCWGEDKSECLLSAEPTVSCSCSSSTSLVRQGGTFKALSQYILLTC
ncbi:unnamed protein product [Phytophthora fragariaefolia]|uniref:Unnamed protein product n=1 Tax=Phytophthora fragariaefolia TaxID=1490495 RepID=A0A9W6XGI2_9STRA|nr:unnamed protein product [Phytophthora fragariaefolia]